VKITAVGFLGIAGLLSLAAPLAAQTGLKAADSPVIAENVLPEAPEPAAAAAGQPIGHGSAVAPRYTLYINPGQMAQPLDANQKMGLAALQIVNGNIFATSLLSAGWSQLINSDPKYGTDRGAFGQRYGAAILRESSQSLLAGGVMAVVFHDDPRYYVLGDGHGVAHRTWYAVTRVFVTRSDAGTERANLPLLVGYLGAAALTQPYYPEPSRGAGKVFSTYGASLGGSALGYAFHEFLGDGLRLTHIKRD